MKREIGTWEAMMKTLIWQQLGEIKGKRILDFGSGLGITANRYAADNQVIAVEPDAESVNDRWTEHAYRQFIGGVEILKQFEKEAFDIIFCHNVLEYATEREEILGEFHRLLKPDGKLSIVKHNRLGRVMLETVLLNHFENAQDLLSGKDVITCPYGTIHYYEDGDILKWCSDFTISKTYGIRNFWDLQQEQEIQKEKEWQEKMLQMEMRVAEKKEFYGVASFHHLILEKQESRLQQIRESERKSHTEMYSNEELYKTSGWLKKPIKTVQEIIPEFRDYQELRVLDLGCGIGRNCISIAKEYSHIPCIIDCVDILELAIEKLYCNAREHGVAANINGIVKPMEDYSIAENNYDFIMAVSALEHIDSSESFVKKLEDINKGIRKNGIVCLVVNSNVREKDKATGQELPAQFEVNLSTEELQMILNAGFADWTVLKSTVQEQQYDIPRESGISELRTSVVTFVARK